MAVSTTGAPETLGQPEDDGAEGAELTELAVLEAARDEKRQLLDRAAGLAATQLRRGSLPDGCSKNDLPALLQRYYWSEPAAEVLGHDPAELAALAVGHL